MENNNQLEVIIQESGLETTKAQFLLDNFTNYFKIASEWETKAKAIKVTDEAQTAEMKMAREGRLFLREKRIAIEKARKQLKEQSLREGKAIDGIANILKGLIIPIEEYLDEQEKFVENKEKARLEAERIEAEKKAEEERLAKEQAEREEQERIRKENEALRKEAEEKEKAVQKEREEARKKQEELEANARKEAEEKERILAEQRTREQEEARAKEEAEKALKGKKVSDFLAQHGYSDETKDRFHIIQSGNSIQLFARIAQLNI